MKFAKNLSFAAAAMLAVLSVVPHVRADAFEDAGRAFAAGRFDESARDYEAVLKKDGYSAPVLFNLGNSELRAGRPGEAILHYQQAKWLAPADPDIAANLRFAQKKAGVPIVEESWAGRAADALSPDAWAWLAGTSLVLLCAGLLGMQLRNKQVQAFRLAGAFGGLVLIVAGSAVAVRASQLDRAVIPTVDTPVLISPFSGAQTVYKLPAGQTVNVEKVHGDFSLVRDAEGRAGWVANAQVSRIVPSPAST